MKRVLAAGLAFCALAWAARAEETAERTAMMPGSQTQATETLARNVPWTAAPSIGDVAAAYPERARRARIAGWAFIACRIDRDGRLTICRAATEAPRNQGFAQAALSLSSRFRAPAGRPGFERLAGASTLVRIRFTPGMLDSVTTLPFPPAWSATPRGDEPGGGFPRTAAQAGVLDAHVQVDCTVGPDGRLADCAVASEDHPGYGFGAAAAALARGFALPLWSEDGLPSVGARLRVPIHYALPPSAAR